MEELEGQYSVPPDCYVCQRCVTDSFLKDALMSSEDTEHICSYCGLEDATSIGVLLKEIGDAIRDEYTDPTDELHYESREGGYPVGEVYSGQEILEEIGSWTNSDDLYADVENAFSLGEWCRRDPLGLDQYDERWLGWMEFSEIIKHRTRYLFFDDSSDEEIVLPSRLLDTLGNLFREFYLFTDLPKGTELVRARVVNAGESPSTAAELGAAPAKLATQNRMSPAGISMFYASFDELTSVRETYDPDLSKEDATRPPERGWGKKLVLATFKTTKDFRMLDLGRDLELPSCFDTERRWQRKLISFLQDFVEDFSKPVERDGREHFEYAPTQVVTEYVRHRLVDNEGQKVDGVLYLSAANPGKKAVVVFGGPELCGAVEDSFNEAKPVLQPVGFREAAPEEFE